MNISKLESDIAATIDKMRIPKTAPITRKCDCCEKAQAVLDAPTIHGPWAYMCVSCAATHAVDGYARIGTRLLAVPTAQLPWTPAASEAPAPSTTPLPATHEEPTLSEPRVFHSSETDADLALGWYHTTDGAAEAIGPFNCVTDAIADYSK